MCIRDRYLGNGIVVCNGKNYEDAGMAIIPVNAKTVSFQVQSLDANRRVRLLSVYPGISINLTEEDITSCRVSLRSDLSITSPSWQVSEIEVQAYYPHDISEAVANIADDVPILYRSGYKDDWSEWRRFYVSEPVSMDGNLMTIKGQDASARLSKVSLKMSIANIRYSDATRALYNKIRSVLSKAGISYKMDPIPKATKGSTNTSILFKEMTGDAFIKDVNLLAHANKSFMPTFVDAGIPRLTWKNPSVKWIINETECGDVVRNVDRNIAKIFCKEEDGLMADLHRSNKWIDLVKDQSQSKKGKINTISLEGYWWAFQALTRSLTGSHTAYQAGTGKAYRVKDKYGKLAAHPSDVTFITTASTCKWIGKKVTTAKKNRKKIPYRLKSGKIRYKTITWKVKKPLYTIRGKRLSFVNRKFTISDPNGRTGQSIELSPITLGRFYYKPKKATKGVTLYPNYSYLFKISNITGSFTWKGDPRMQPRDLFYFVTKEGREIVCTIESIEIKHEGGGTTANIAYREGIV